MARYDQPQLESMLAYDGPWSAQMARELARELLSALIRIDALKRELDAKKSRWRR